MSQIININEALQKFVTCVMNEESFFTIITMGPNLPGIYQDYAATNNQKKYYHFFSTIKKGNASVIYENCAPTTQAEYELDEKRYPVEVAIAVNGTIYLLGRDFSNPGNPISLPENVRYMRAAFEQYYKMTIKTEFVNFIQSSNISKNPNLEHTELHTTEKQLSRWLLFSLDHFDFPDICDYAEAKLKSRITINDYINELCGFYKIKDMLLQKLEMERDAWSAFKQSYNLEKEYYNNPVENGIADTCELYFIEALSILKDNRQSYNNKSIDVTFQKNGQKYTVFLFANRFIYCLAHNIDLDKRCFHVQRNQKDLLNTFGTLHFTVEDILEVAYRKKTIYQMPT